MKRHCDKEIEHMKNLVFVNNIENTIYESEQYKESLEVLERIFVLNRDFGLVKGIQIIGDSGAGKSKIIEKFKALHPSIRKDDHEHKPVMVVEMPVSPTIRSFCKCFLDALHRPYAEKASQDFLTRQLKSALVGCKPYLFIIDEAQHLVEGKFLKKDPRQVADWIKHLMNDTGVSIALVGISSIAKLTEANEQLARRFSQRIYLKPYSADTKKNIDQLLNLLDKFFENSGYKGDWTFLAKPTSLERLCFASDGLVGYISPFVAEAVRLATEKNLDGTLTIQHLNQAFENQILPSASSKKNPFHKNFEERPLNLIGEPFYRAII
tara:strand:- start:3764 stop:4732 length:969 start_codon:yes stop_codon:yes gene_type:complete